MFIDRIITKLITQRVSTKAAREYTKPGNEKKLGDIVEILIRREFRIINIEEEVTEDFILELKQSLKEQGFD